MTAVKDKVKELFDVGAHYAYSRSRRHPSVSDFIFGTKNTVEIFDLEKTQESLDKALEFVGELAKGNKKILFVSAKSVARDALVTAAEKLKMPYVAGRWIGGTLTNFDQIKKRIEKLNDLKEKKEKGKLDKYTKHERLLIDREIDDLTRTFGGLVDMESVPKAMFVIDPKQEETSVHEAQHLGIPVIALASSDCDISQIEYPIPANDTNIKSIRLFIDKIVEAYNKALK